MAEGGARKAVSLVVPFAGDTDDARATLLAWRQIALRSEDEVIVVDNSRDGVLGHLEHRPPVVVVTAREQPSSYYARNIGAEQAKNDWLLFLDADCLPTPSLIDDYVSDPIADDVGAVAGAVLPPDVPMGVVGRYKAFRRHLDQGKSTQAEKPWAATANLLVRRAAWEDLGGFSEMIRSGGDIDFSLRLFAAGWRLSYQPRATMRHLHRDSLRAHAAQQIRYGGAHTWIHRRHPEIRMSRPLTKQLPLSAAGALRRAAVGDWEWSLFHLLDGMTAVMLSVGKVRGNAVARNYDETKVAVVADRWPDASEHDACRALGTAVEKNGAVRVEARRRPVRIARDAALRCDYMEDDSPLDTLKGMAWLLTHRPARTARYVLRSGKRAKDVGAIARLAPAARRIATRGGRHLHAVDDVGASDARALADLLGTTYSAGDERVVSAMDRLDGERSQNL
jgi:GT2 family glycosyltransferase